MSIMQKYRRNEYTIKTGVLISLNLKYSLLLFYEGTIKNLLELDNNIIKLRKEKIYKFNYPLRYIVICCV